MQKQLEALKQEIANAQERLRIAQEDLRQAIDADEIHLRLTKIMPDTVGGVWKGFRLH